MNFVLDKFDKSILQDLIVRFKNWLKLEVTDHLILKNKIIIIDRAPEPSDVRWENCGVKYKQKFISRLTTFIITAIVLACCFFAILGINYW